MINQLQSKLRSIGAIISLALIVSSCANIASKGSSRLDLIKRRGELKCGISGKIPGFSYLKNGIYEGIDIDICKAMAAAFTGNSDNVIYRPLTAPERFTALKTGEVDLLSRNTTFNLSRDAIGGNGVTFAPVIFHDGQGIMVKKNRQIKEIQELDEATICVGSGTTTEQNLNDTFQELKINYNPIKYQDLDQVVAGYLQGRCKAMTSDRSQLAAARSGFSSPNDHIILEYTMSKEPLAPASIGGDQKLSDAMRWVIYALIEAEEKGITKDNINQKLEEAKSDQNLSSIRRLLGVDSGLGEKLGLPDDFVVKIIKSTGNYGEIYERNLGPESNLPIRRGLNKLYTKGGLLISPPIK